MQSLRGGLRGHGGPDSRLSSAQRGRALVLKEDLPCPRAPSSRSKRCSRNPAFLLTDMKRVAVKPSTSLLLGFLSEIDLLVVDEIDFIDFYRPVRYKAFRKPPCQEPS